MLLHGPTFSLAPGTPALILRAVPYARAPDPYAFPDAVRQVAAPCTCMLRPDSSLRPCSGSRRAPCAAILSFHLSLPLFWPPDVAFRRMLSDLSPPSKLSGHFLGSTCRMPAPVPSHRPIICLRCTPHSRTHLHYALPDLHHYSDTGGPRLPPTVGAIMVVADDHFLSARRLRIA